MSLSKQLKQLKYFPASRLSRVAAAASVALACMPATTIAQDSAGKVSFAISCHADSQQAFNQAVALLHNMMYWQARDAFTTITQNDPDCAMPYWGIAMSAFHPLWPGKPNAEEASKGNKAATHLRTLKPDTQREQDYIDTVLAYYDTGGIEKYRPSVAAWANAQIAMQDKHPTDVDAIALSSLAMLALAPKKDKSFKMQQKAGSQMQALLTRAPQHPGAFHYLIHAYDNPLLAEQALPAARAYGKIAPDVAHALHMPTHIFVRVGSWQETIDWNARSAASAKKHSTQGFMKQGYAHAVDYQIYAHLQKGEYELAQKTLTEALAVPKHMDGFAAAYGLTASQARVNLERDKWAAAAQTPIRNPAYLSWDRFAQAEAISHFARGVGAARSGNAQIATAAIESLNALHAKINKKSPYWATLVDSQRNSVAAWLAIHNDDKTKALELMTLAAELEDSVDKSPVTPSVVLPARELLGDMLVILNKPGQAIQAYDQALRKSPNRSRSLRGAMQVAAKAGKKEQASAYREKLRTFTRL